MKSLGLVLLAAKWRPRRQDEPARPEAADGRFGHAGVTSCCIGSKQLPDGRVSPTAATHDGGRYGTLGAEQKRSQESRTALGARGVADATQAGLSKRDGRGLRGLAGGVRAGTRARRRRAVVQVRQAGGLSESRRRARARTVEAIAREHDSTGRSPPVAGQSALAAPASESAVAAGGEIAWPCAHTTHAPIGRRAHRSLCS